MKHRTVWIGLTAAALLLLGGMPFKRSDVARLAPVEALVVSVEQGRVVLDGGDCQGSAEPRGKCFSARRSRSC